MKPAELERALLHDAARRGVDVNCDKLVWQQSKEMTSLLMEVAINGTKGLLEALDKDDQAWASERTAMIEKVVAVAEKTHSLSCRCTCVEAEPKVEPKQVKLPGID